MKTHTRVMIVDDHILFREGLANLVSGQPDFIVVGEASSVAEAVALADALLPDIILMDYSLPDGSGVDATHTIITRHPLIKIVFLTIHDDDEFLFQTMRSGASGYLLKNLPIAKLMTSLRALERQEPAITRQMMKRILDEFARSEAPAIPREPDQGGLTWREIEVLKAVSTGASNEEIANEMVISINTVKNHIHNILEKLNLKNRRELAIFAHQHGLQAK